VATGAHAAKKLDWRLDLLPTSENDTARSCGLAVNDQVELNIRCGVELTLIAQPYDSGGEQLPRGPKP
jgi:hypothetical protein